MEEKCTLHMKWVMLHFAVNDFCGWLCMSAVGPPALRAVWEAATWTFVRSCGKSVLKEPKWGVWWGGLDIIQGLLVVSAWSWRPAQSKLRSSLPLLFLKHSQYWECSVEVLKFSITRSFSCESL